MKIDTGFGVGSAGDLSSIVEVAKRAEAAGFDAL